MDAPLSTLNMNDKQNKDEVRTEFIIGEWEVDESYRQSLRDIDDAKKADRILVGFVIVLIASICGISWFLNWIF